MPVSLSNESLNALARSAKKSNYSAKIRSLHSFKCLSKSYSKSVRKTDLALRSKLNEIFAALNVSATCFQHLSEGELNELGKIVSSMCNTFELYEKVDFFHSHELERQLGQTLNIAFKLEANLKKTRSKGRKRLKDPSILLERIAYASKSAIYSKNA